MNTTARELRRPADILADALADLERAVGTPLVPGDMDGWVDAVAAGVTQCMAVWQPVTRAHAATFSMIVAHRVELDSQIQTLREREAALHAEARRLLQVSLALERGAAHPDIDPDGRDAARDLRREVQMWIARCRALERAVDTWYAEACYRDCGAQD